MNEVSFYVLILFVFEYKIFRAALAPIIVLPQLAKNI